MNLRNSDDARNCFQEVFINLYKDNQTFKIIVNKSFTFYKY